MSHSRIFQISRKPINKDNYIDESRYYDGFVGEIADYVSDDTDKDADLEWLQESNKNAIIVDKENNKFTIINKIKYFEPRYEEWKKQIEKISKLSLEQFAGNEDTKKEFDYSDVGINHYLLETAFNDKFSFYIDDYDEDYGLISFDTFMRNVHDNDTFYIGATIDYHM